MRALGAMLMVFDAVLRPVLRLGRGLAWVALALMVLVILAQVVFRYVIGSALPWPDEAARFLMLWMTALIAPSAYRWGGFVSIDMVVDALPSRVGALTALVLLLISLLVLVVAVQLGTKHVVSGCLFNSSTLYVPFTLEIDWLSPCDAKPFAWGGFEWARVKLAWMYFSLLVGVTVCAAVNLELILKALMKLIDPEVETPQDPDRLFVSAD